MSSVENTKFLEDFEIKPEEVSEIILVDCPGCEEELATYKKTDTIDSNQESNTTARSKMLQAARS